VKLHVTLLGGGFGRRINPDFTVEAALVSQKARRPVKVVWTREDDLRHDFYRPCAMHRIEASLGADGYPVAWRHRMSSAAIDATFGPARGGGFGGSEGDGAGNMSYRVPNRSLEYTLLDSGVPRGWWRAVHTTHTTFAVESFIDELAQAAGKDPVEYRLALIDRVPVERPGIGSRDFPFSPERLKAVLRLAAEKAGWNSPVPPGRFRGVACGFDHLSYAAEVVEVSVLNRAVKIERIVCAADCGPVMNPSGARAQLEGGIIQALSAATRERVTIAGGGVEQRNFDGYPILRINEAPPVIETWFVETDTNPSGLGEPAVPPLAPALANAVARATGQRPRSLPFRLG
jgi:isoquinoline 1-oxidoreductase beta subunit